MKEINVEQLTNNPFTMIGKEWMLVTAEKEGKVNTMTASWGGLGIMWGKNVAFVFIRPQRYTKEFVDANEKLTLSFYDSDQKKMLGYMGSVSGRDEDKIGKMGLTTMMEEGAPYFEGANTVLVCKKLYSQEMKEECFLQTDLVDHWFKQKDFHTMYVVEIEKVLVNK